MPSINYAFVNGQFLPEDRATVSIFDRGFLYGEGCFETMRVYEGRFFRARHHFDRLFAGLKSLGIESPFSAEEVNDVCRKLTQMNGISSGVVRVYITPNSSVVTSQPRVFATRVLRAIVSTVRVDPLLARNKTANRLPYILAQREATAAGADDAVLLNASGNLVELTTSNLFVVHKGRLLTPPLVDGPLPGVTRRAVIELAEKLKILVCEQSLSPESLEGADETLATNSLIEIVPISNWSRDDAVTRRLQAAYRQLVQTEAV